jgi:hypothetical protein
MGDRPPVPAGHAGFMPFGMKIMPKSRPPLCAPVIIAPCAPSKACVPKEPCGRAGPVAHWAYLERSNRERPAVPPQWPAHRVEPSRPAPEAPRPTGSVRIGEVTPVAAKAVITRGRVRTVREVAPRVGRMDLVI